MNQVILMGRLTKDPTVTHTSGENQMCVARFSLAVNRRVKKEGDELNADFINCVSFGKTAEFIEKFTHKGTKLIVIGRIQTGSYTNKEGARVNITDVVIESCEFAESKGSGESNRTSENDDFLCLSEEDLKDCPI